jgi:hypothetical protein
MHMYRYTYFIMKKSSLPKNTVGEGKLRPIGGSRNCKAIFTLPFDWSLCLFFGNEIREILNATELSINNKMVVAKTSLNNIDDDPAMASRQLGKLLIEILQVRQSSKITLA